MPNKDIIIGKKYLYKLAMQENYEEVTVLSVEDDLPTWDENNVLIINNKKEKFYVSEDELEEKKMKFIITFGSSQLDEFYVRPNDVALIIEAENENEARNQVCNFKGIGERFCTSYPYEKYIDEFVNKYNMKEYTFEDLENLRIKGK